MEEISWRAKLAKSNINILSVNPDTAISVVEFTYHPKPNVFKWCKTMFPYRTLSDEMFAEYLLTEVLKLRKELEPHNGFGD